MAAGLSLAPDQLEPAMARLGELLAAQGAGERRRRAACRIDGLLGAGRARRRSSPSGSPRPAPTAPESPAPRLAVAGGADRRARGGSATAIWRWRSPTASAGGSRPWRSAPSRARSALPGSAGGGAPAHLAGRLERDDWGGRARVKLHVEDAARPADPRRSRFALDPVRRGRTIHSAPRRAPFVYRLGRQIFNLERRVRLP